MDYAKQIEKFENGYAEQISAVQIEIDSIDAESRTFTERVISSRNELEQFDGVLENLQSQKRIALAKEQSTAAIDKEYSEVSKAVHLLKEKLSGLDEILANNLEAVKALKGTVAALKAQCKEECLVVLKAEHTLRAAALAEVQKKLVDLGFGVSDAQSNWGRILTCKNEQLF